MIGSGRLGVFDERGNRPIFGAADANPFLRSGDLVRAGIGTRFGVGDVDRVVLGDEYAARPAELPPLVEKAAVLIEDLDAVVLAIGDEQPAARVDRDAV